MKTMFSLWSCGSKCFVGNVLCSYDDSHATYSRSALVHDKQCLLQTPRRKNPEELNLEGGGSGNGSYPIITELPVQKDTNLLI
jgi:hypothetical protein